MHHETLSIPRVKATRLSNTLIFSSQKLCKCQSKAIEIFHNWQFQPRQNIYHMKNKMETNAIHQNYD
jgi:hypothetical protein